MFFRFSLSGRPYTGLNMRRREGDEFFSEGPSRDGSALVSLSSETRTFPDVPGEWVGFLSPQCLDLVERFVNHILTTGVRRTIIGVTAIHRFARGTQVHPVPDWLDAENPETKTMTATDPILLVA
jgi:hypothetical protein